MKIVSVCACTSGIAHTYNRKRKINPCSWKHGTQQSKWKHREQSEQKDELTAEEIKEADVVILAVDIAITGTERFEGKPTNQSSYKCLCKST